MASFDFIDASSKGYEFTWRYRSYIARVAIPVIFVKIVCLLGIFVFDIEGDKLREGLVMMPSIVMEALFVVGVIRFALYKEPIFIWGKTILPPSPDPKKDPVPMAYSGSLSKIQSIKAGVALYMLAVIFIVVIDSLLPDKEAINLMNEKALDAAAAGEKSSASPFAPIMMIAMIVGMFWGVRLLWLFVPVAMGHRIRHFLTAANGFKISFCLIMTWLICTLPLSIIYETFLSAQKSLFSEGNAADILTGAILKSVAETIVISIQASAAGFGIYTIFKKPNKKSS